MRAFGSRTREPKMKAYIDTDIVLALAKGDIPDEMEPLLRVLEACDQGKGQILTSSLTGTELDKYRGTAPPAVRAIYLLVRKVPTISAQTLLGIDVTGDARTWVNSPVLQNNPIWEHLLSIGVEDMDAQHLLAAVKADCGTFLTCDGGILHRAKDIAGAYKVSCTRPSELVKKLGW
jgi:predicted nucleic acid-binding protein